MSARRPLGRFAPSPSGPLHLGSLLAAVASWLSVKSRGGDWVVRMEDLDPPREKSGVADQILQTLEAFGLHSDHAVVYQSARSDLYQAALERLIASELVYPCSCSRAALAGHLIYPKWCEHGPRDPQRALAWRLKAPDAAYGFRDQIVGEYAQNLAREVGDFVLKRADGWHAYQLAVVLDDAAQGVTEVVRGADLLDSTPRQIYLQQQLGLPTPAYAHLPLLLNTDGSKLSKSTAALPVDPLAPMPALRYVLGMLCQSVPEGDRPDQVLAHAAQGFAWRAMP